MSGNLIRVASFEIIVEKYEGEPDGEGSHTYTVIQHLKDGTIWDVVRTVGIPVLPKMDDITDLLEKDTF